MIFMRNFYKDCLHLSCETVIEYFLMSDASSELPAENDWTTEMEVKNGIYGLNSSEWISTLSYIADVESGRTVLFFYVSYHIWN
jgi:hypothetical protein